MKKKLIICVGNKAFIDGIGLETQALDSEGIGTGLPNVIIEPEVEVASAADVKELYIVIKNDLIEDRDRIVLLSGDVIKNPVDLHRIDELKSNGVLVHELTADSDKKGIVEKITSVSPELAEVGLSIGTEGHGDEPDLDPYANSETIEENFFCLENKPKPVEPVEESLAQTETVDAGTEHCDSPEEQTSVSYTRDELFKEIADDVSGLFKKDKDDDSTPAATEEPSV